MALLARSSASSVRPARSSGVRSLARPVSKVVGGRRSVAVRAESSPEFDSEKLIKDLSEKWDKVENKTGVVLYGAGAVVLLWLSSAIVSAIDHVPLIPKLMELVGLGYSAWFVYRYLLFRENRAELVKDVDVLKKKITGGDL